MHENARVGSFQPILSSKPLIELLGSKDVHYGLYLLGLAGLSEPFLYLKKFEDLSAGQQYRAMLAQLLSFECNIWIADDFCANLDPTTANIVSHNIQRVARKVGATVIVAAPHSRNFVFSLKPDKVVHLTSAWTHSVINGNEFCQNMRKLFNHEGFCF
jgi:ABC-type ATPase with predicted acetyltransferase domain